MQADKTIFEPVMEPYAPRVIATYLARAFNGGVAEVPPTASPVWPLAVRMAADMRRAGYALGAYHSSELRAPAPVQLPEPHETVATPIRPRARVQPVRSGYGHADRIISAARGA
jgi:hypothetical protein